MRILLSMPNDHQSNDYIVNALQDLGHEVFYVDHRAQMKQCIEFVPQILKLENIDIMLVLYLIPDKTYPKEFIRDLKVKFPNITYISWLFDATVQDCYADMNKDLIDILKEYDYFFTVCRGQIESFRSQGVNAYFAQEGFSPYTFNFMGRYKQTYDVSFIGAVGHPFIHKERLFLMKQIINNFQNTIIYGPIYTDDHDILTHHVKRPTITDVEHSKVVATSKINIGHSGWPEIDGYFSARNYRIMGSGGFLMANRSKNITDFFKEDKEIVIYNDVQECLDKIKFYLKNEELRKRIAIAGYKRVLKDYTFNKSINNIMKVITQ